MNRYKLAQLYNKSGKLSQRWYVAYYFRHPETNQFERHTHWISSRLKTKSSRTKKGNELVDLINGRLKRGWSPYQQQEIQFTNIMEAIQGVVELKCSSSRKRTVNTYRSFSRTFISWLRMANLGTLYVEEFNYRHATRYMDYIKLEKRVNNRTYNNYLIQMRTFFNVLVKREYISHNPFQRIDKLQEQEAQITAFTKDELKQLKEYLYQNDPALWMACQFIFYCFIRPNELVQLTFNDIDLKNQRITIRPHASKNKRQQVIIIPVVFMPSLIEFTKIPHAGSQYIFSTGLLPGDNKIESVRISERFRKHANILGLNKKMYDLKHTGAGMALENGVNILDLKHQLRHHSLDVTQQYLAKFKAIAGEDYSVKFPEI